MIEDQTVSLPFGGGTDTKSDSKMSLPIKCNLLKDCIFTKLKRLTKRNGYDLFTNSVVGGTTWSSPTLVKSYRDELLLAATTSSGKRLLSYSSALSKWQDKGKNLSIKVSKKVINGLDFYPSSTQTGSTNSFGTYNSSFVALGNIGLYAFDGMPNTGAGTGFGYKNTANTTYITVTDLTTGTHLADTVQITGALGFSKAVVLGTTALAVFYISVTSPNLLAFRIITVNGSGVSVGNEISVGICAALATLTDQMPYSYDIVTTATGAIAAVAHRPNLDLYTVSTIGAVSAATTITSSGDIEPVSATLASNGNVWVYWVSAATTVKYAIYSSSLVLVLAATTIDTNGADNIVAIPLTNTTQRVYYSMYAGSGTTSAIIFPGIFVAPVDSSGTVGGPALFMSGCELYGKSFQVNSVNYLPLITFSQTQSTGFLVDADDIPSNIDAVSVAKFLQTEAEGIYSSGFGITGGATTVATLICGRIPGLLNSVYNISGSKYSMGAGVVLSLNQTATGISANLSSSPLFITNSAKLGTALITFDFAHIDANQAVIQQDTLVLNGGIVSMYDGSSLVELGFSVDPDNVGSTVNASGGSMDSATYFYYLTYEWTDANGNLYQSAPSLAVKAIISSGTSNSITIIAPNPTVTRKTNLICKLWRSDSVAGGNIAYLVASQKAQSSSSRLTFLDTAAAGSTAITNGPTLYTQNGAILENIAPPPSMILWVNNNRLWCVDSENPETNIEYSKTASQGTGISFSTGQLELVVDSRGGDITGAIAMDEKTVIFKEAIPLYFTGDGANDSGQGSSITIPQFVPSDTGCSNSKSVILFPGGVLFRATDNKGVYLFSRGVQVEYFGFDVEDYNSQNILSAQIIGDKNQIRFLTSSGDSLLYDYVMKQWSVFTNHEGVSSDLYGGVYIYVRSDGSLYLENQTGTYLDNTTAISPLIQISWIKVMSIQGFQRIRRVALLGDFLTANAGHGVQISTAYDFRTTFSAPVPYYFSGSNGTFQYRERLSRQKCDSFQLQIQEITTGATGEFIDFSDLGIEIAAKKGLNKLPVSASVG